MRSAFLIGVALACSGCNVIEQPQGLIQRWTTAWREVATDNDQSRLRDWRATFVAALTAARTAGHSGEIAREGALLDPDSALGGGPIPNGLFEVGVPRHDSALGRCAELKPIQGLMMGRHSFYIHGQGKTGSEGCIVPVHGRLEQVLHLVTLLRSKGPLYLRVEGSDTLDLPDKPSDTFVA